MVILDVPLLQESMSVYEKRSGLGPLWSGSNRLPKMEGRGVLLDFIPDVGQLILPQIPVEGRFTDSYENGLLDGAGNPMYFPVHIIKL